MCVSERSLRSFGMFRCEYELFGCECASARVSARVSVWVYVFVFSVMFTCTAF